MQESQKQRKPTTQVIKASQARQEWSRILNRVFRGETRVIVEKSGIPVAAIISVEDLGRFTQLEVQRQARLRVLEATWDAFRNIPDEELEREVSRAVAEARQARRTHHQKPKRDKSA